MNRIDGGVGTSDGTFLTYFNYHDCNVVSVGVSFTSTRPSSLLGPLLSTVPVDNRIESTFLSVLLKTYFSLVSVSSHTRTFRRCAFDREPFMTPDRVHMPQDPVRKTGPVQTPSHKNTRPLLVTNLQPSDDSSLTTVRRSSQTDVPPPDVYPPPTHVRPRDGPLVKVSWTGVSWYVRRRRRKMKLWEQMGDDTQK